MDQSAFRALLATETSKSNATKPTGTKFGAPPPKRLASTETSSGAKPEFKPRVQKDKSKYKKKAEEGNASGGAYRDRAAERRTGGPSDFAEAEKTLEDFKARADGADVDKSVLEEQMKYLGGDATHSVLVKGLDMALLERMKHQQATEGDKSLEEVEDELDRALVERPQEKEKGKGKGKRTRDEMIAEMKAGRSGSLGGDGGRKEEDGGERKRDPRFKPIAAPTTTGQPEKKLRKKKKKIKIDSEGSITAPPSASTSALPPPPPPPPAAAAPLPSIPITVNLEDDEFDIFGDAGEYKGLGSGSDSDDNDDDEKKPVVAAAPSRPPPTSNKQKYFDDDDDDEMDRMDLSTAPSAVTNLAAGGVHEGGEEDEQGGSGSGSDDEGAGAGGDGSRPMRLQPLSGSNIPSVRDLLDMDAAQEKEEKRKEKKTLYQMKAADKKEAMLKAMTPEQRAEHEYQVMQSYMEKKERKKNGTSTKEDEMEDEDEVANRGRE